MTGRVLWRDPFTRSLIRECTFQEVEPLAPFTGKEDVTIRAGVVPSIWFAAENRGIIVGCGAITLYPKGRCRLRALFVLPEYRGKGLGYALVKTRLRVCAERGATRIETHSKQHGIMTSFGAIAEHFDNTGRGHYVFPITEGPQP